MISDVEISPTSRARCSVCDNKILKGEPRGRKSTGDFVCKNCFGDYVDGLINNLKDLDFMFTKLLKKTNV